MEMSYDIELQTLIKVSINGICNYFCTYRDDRYLCRK